MTAGSALTVGYVLGRHGETSQTFVRNEIAEMRRQGHRVVILGLRSAGERIDPSDVALLSEMHAPFLTTLVDLGREAVRSPAGFARFLIRVWRLRSEMGRRGDAVRWWRLPRAARWLRSAGVDILHAHFAWSGATAAWCLSALTGTPWSMTVHANDIYNDRRNLAAKLSAARLVVTVCEANRAYLLEQFAVGTRIAVITCGVELAPTRTGPPSVDVVTVGRLVPKKGIDVVVRAAHALHTHGHDITVEIVGDGPLRGELATLVTSLELADTVRLLGPLDHAATLARIADARVVCLPCRIAPDGDRDAMPTVLVEAMMRGVPVVSTRVVGIPEMVDSTTGRLTDPDDIPALTAAIAELLGDAALADRLGAEGARRARADYDVATQTARLATELRAAARS